MDADIEQEPSQSPTAYIVRHPFLFNKFGGWADIYLYGSDAPSAMSALPKLAPFNTNMRRRLRPWYFFPLVINVALIYSSKNLLLTLDTPQGEDVEFPVCEWLLYTSVAISSPLFLVMSRLLPDPSIGLCLGGLFSSGGLLWAGMATPGSLEQKLAYSLGNGLGISLSMQAITLAMSPYFVKEGVQAACSTLLLSMIAMLTTHHVTGYLSVMIGNYGFMVFLGILVLVTSCLPPVAHLMCRCIDHMASRRHRTHIVNKAFFGDVPFVADKEQRDSNHQGSGDEEALLTDHQQDTDLEDDKILSDMDTKQKGCLKTMGHGLAVIMEDTGWKTSLLSVLVWLTWGAGVDTTWLDIGWTHDLLPYPHRLPSLHLIMCFVLLAFKLCSQFWLTSDSRVRVNLASNYMYLGLLGCSGVLLCLFPEFSHPLHGSLLFTASLALQYDDLSDLYLLPTSAYRRAHKWKTGTFSAMMTFLSPFSRPKSSHLPPSEVNSTFSPASKDSTLVPSSFKPQSFSVSLTPELASDSVSTYTLVKCDVLNEVHPCHQQEGPIATRGGGFTLLCLVGHSLSLFFMATLSMVLGLQIANLLRQLFTLPPFSLLCSSGGLLVLSSAAIGVSLGKPDVWVGDRRGYAVIA